MLQARSPLGAPLAALATQINAMAQPRPRFARNPIRRRYLRLDSRLQRCTSRAGHSAGRLMPGAARERFARPPAGTALAPLSGLHPESTLRGNERRVLYSIGDNCQALSPMMRQQLERAMLFVLPLAFIAAMIAQDRESRNYCRALSRATGLRHVSMNSPCPCPLFHQQRPNRRNSKTSRSANNRHPAGNGSTC